MVLNTVKENDTAPNKYALEIAGTASLAGIPSLTLEGAMKARIYRMGKAVYESVTLGNGDVLPISFTSEEANLTTVSGSASLKAAGILDASGNFAIDIGEPDNNNRRAIDITATDVSTFVGIGLDTPEKRDDIGASLSNGEFILNLDENNNYTYEINNADVALTGIDLFEFSGKVNASGDKDKVSLELDDLTLSISDYARLQGDFGFDVSSENGTQVINLTAADASAFIGIGAGTTDDKDDVGVKLSSVNGAVRLLKDENGEGSFAYGLSGDVALVGIDGLTLTGNVAASANQTGKDVTIGGETIASGINQISGTGINLDVANLTSLSGDIIFNIRESDGAILAAGKNLSASVSLSDGLAGGLSDGTLGLVMLDGGKYALQGSGAANLKLGDDLEFTGDLGIEVNRTGQVVNENIQIGEQQQLINFSSASDFTRFNASNLDMILTQSIKDALIEGADKLINLKGSLVPEYDEKGNLKSESLLSKALPGTDATIDKILGISTYLSLGDSMKAYVSPIEVDDNTQQTLQGLISHLRTEWLPTLPIAKGLDFVIGESGFSLSYASDNSFKRDIGLSLNQEAYSFGLELEGDVDIELDVDLGIDFDLSFDWKDFTSNFDLNKLSFNADAAANDLVLGAYFGPVGLSIGSDEVGKEKGQANLSLGGNISYVNGEFDVDTSNNKIDVVLPVYATLAGNDLSGEAGTAKAFIKGELFGGDGIKFSHENFDKLVNFKDFGVGDVLVMFQDLIRWAEEYRQYDIMQTEIPFVDQSLGGVLDFASAINENVLEKIDFYRPRVDLLSGSSAAIAEGKLTVANGNFTEELRGKIVTIDGGSYRVTSVEDATTLVLDGADDVSLTGKDFVVHERCQLLRTYQELIVAINNSGILPLSVPLTYDPIKNEIVIPFSFQKELALLKDQALNLGIDLGDIASLSTDAKTSIKADVDGRMDLVINFGTAEDKGVKLFVDNVELNGRASLEVQDLEVNAQLGFVGLTAEGAGTGSGVRMAATVSTGLDRDPNAVTPGDRRFSFSDLLSGDLFDSFYFNLDGDAYAKLKGLSVNGGFGDISISDNAELSVYVPKLSEVNSPIQTVTQPVTQQFDLQQAINDGTVKNEGIVVVMPDVSDLLSLKNLSFETVLAGVRAGIDFMQESLEDEVFYNTPIPVINTSLSETFNFLDDLTMKLESVAANPAGMLQEVETAIESALGIKDEAFSLGLSNGNLDINFNWKAIFSDKFDFNLDLNTFKELSGNVGAAALDAIDSFADLAGGGNLTLEAIAELNFDIGINLDSLLKGEAKIFLRDYDKSTGKGTHAQIGARVEGRELDLNFKAGPINLGINNGTVVLDADGNLETKDYAGLLVAIDQKAGSTPDDGLFYIGEESFGDNFQVKVNGGFDVNLPLRMELAGFDTNIGTFEVKTNPVYGDQGLVQLFKHLAKSADKGTENPLVMKYPDIRMKFEELGCKFSLL